MKRYVIIALLLLLVAFLLVLRLFPQSVTAKSAPQCKKVNAECSINDSNKQCCTGLFCQTSKNSNNGKCVAMEDPTPTPTPTPEPEITPTPTPEPTDVPKQPEQPFEQPCRGCGEEPKAPACPNSDVVVAPQNFHVLRNGDAAIAKWVPTAGNLVNLYYREVGQIVWTHAVRDELNDGYVTITHLNPSQGYEFALQQHEGCAGGQIAVPVVIDPPVTTWTVFKTNYYTWL